MDVFTYISVWIGGLMAVALILACAAKFFGW